MYIDFTCVNNNINPPANKQQQQNPIHTNIAEKEL